jgi:hypothetical protein
MFEVVENSPNLKNSRSFGEFLKFGGFFLAPDSSGVGRGGWDGTGSSAVLSETSRMSHRQLFLTDQPVYSQLTQTAPRDVMSKR